MATLTHPILADLSAGISELKKNPMAVPAEVYEALLEKLEDMALVEIVKKRLDQPEIEVDLNDL